MCPLLAKQGYFTIMEDFLIHVILDILNFDIIVSFLVYFCLFFFFIFLDKIETVFSVIISSSSSWGKKMSAEWN